MPAIYVLDVPEFRPIVEDALRRGAPYVICELTLGYFKIEHPTELLFNRRDLGVKPAVWYGLVAGGLDGSIEQFDRDTLRIVGIESPQANAAAGGPRR